MKPAFTFFLFIVFLLTDGNNPAHAGASLFKSQVSGQTSIKKIQQAGAEINQQVTLQSNNSGSEKQKDLVVFVADEDVSEDIMKRYNPQTIRFAQVFYAFILSYPGSMTGNCLSLYTLPFFSSACKYIEQRSLRI